MFCEVPRSLLVVTFRFRCELHRFICIFLLVECLLCCEVQRSKIYPLLLVDYVVKYKDLKCIFACDYAVREVYRFDRQRPEIHCSTLVLWSTKIRNLSLCLLHVGFCCVKRFEMYPSYWMLILLWSIHRSKSVVLSVASGFAFVRSSFG